MSINGSFADDELHAAFDHPGEDYQQEDEETELGEKFESETDRTEQKEDTRSWLLSQCESFSSLSENEEEPNTTDPYLSHQLYLPYYKIQRPRHFQSTSGGEESKPIRLPRRPRSPIRQILPGKFDLKTAYQQWDRKRRVTERRKYLEESKERISQSIRRLSDQGIDEHTLISSVVLQAVCEQVTLAMSDVKIDINIQTFVNIAVIWALSDMEIFDYDLYFDKNVQPENSRFFNWKQQDIIDVMGSGGMRKILLGVYRVPFSCNIITSLHRRLPWPYVSPSHERGHTKFYPHVRERIDEKIARDTEEDHTHVPDLNCFHLKEVLDKSYVAYRRKSKSFVVRIFSKKEKRDLFMQLLSLM
ncbi:uncharacterized protein LOC143264132 isoform X2 [Megachile rotundata]|uniref:uncharacterized protein LOC143264132 isoform X2 n=1 Tax=Megachile rotundata TaxID=143995 RepID=UPI003FD1E16E